MKFTKKNDNNITINGVRLGLTLRDSVAMRREADHTPRLQTFTLGGFFGDHYDPPTMFLILEIIKTRRSLEPGVLNFCLTPL